MLGKAFFKGGGLLDSASLHSVLLFAREGGSATAFSSPTDAEGRAVMDQA
ncbi:hypothetical protein [Bradyrhizobium japonicum]|nr:hypothetical protein [Bradyrhizobium japonicum]WLB59254.1 hypothetical protein QIH94_02105 [Bradyrhizobium japonicum]